MTHTKPNWRVALKAGDRLNVSATYDTRKASWYESMGIMVVFYADGKAAEAKDPFASKVDWRGLLTHGHLPENREHGGKPRPRLPDARTLPNGVFSSNLEIKGFSYELGNLLLAGKKGRPPLVRAGESLTFTNLDAITTMSAQESAYHTITSCKAPCTGTSGIAYPLADGKVAVRLGRARLRPARLHAGGQPQHLADAQEPQGRHLHVLLPHPPVHARRVPGGRRRASRRADALQRR